MNIPIIAYVGEKEDYLNESLMEKYDHLILLFEFRKIKECFDSFRWKELTTVKGLFCVRVFPGHHNFQAECGPQVLACLKEDFDKIISITKMN